VDEERENTDVEQQFATNSTNYSDRLDLIPKLSD
jgi:hypothetical protein